VSNPHVPIPAGASVLVEVGMLNFHWSLSNDLEVYSPMNVPYVIESHSTGG
jgi:hypothetical protein